MVYKWWSLTTILALLVPTSNGFLFPDIQLRSGLFRREIERPRTGLSEMAGKYRIAVLQKEPYIFANNTGYVPDLLRHIAETMRLAGVEDFTYDIIPVKSWHQLLIKAKRASSLLSFGLVFPSLEITSWPYKTLDVSSPVLLSSLKLAMKTEAAESRFHDNDIEPDVSGFTLIALKGSPIEYLLLHGNNYNGNYYSAHTPDEAFEAVLKSDNSVLVDDSATLDYFSNKYPSIIQDICPQRLPGSMLPFYGFFGRDKHLLSEINAVITVLTADGTLQRLANKYFNLAENCS